MGKQQLNLIWGFVWGETAFEDVWGAGLVAFIGDLIAGFIFFGDIRDLIKNWIIQPLRGKGPWWLNLLLGIVAILALVPGWGDGLKVIVKGLMKLFMKEAAEKIAKEILERLLKEFAQEAIDRLVRELGEELVTELVEKLGERTLKELVEQFGETGVKQLTAEFSVDGLKVLVETFSVKGLKEIVDGVGIQALKDLVARFGETGVKELVDAFTVKGLKDLLAAFPLNTLKDLVDTFLVKGLKNLADRIGIPALKDLVDRLADALKPLVAKFGVTGVTELVDTFSVQGLKQIVDGVGVQGLKDLADAFSLKGLKELVDTFTIDGLRQLLVAFPLKSLKELVDTFAVKGLKDLVDELGIQTLKDLTPDALKQIGTFLTPKELASFIKDLGVVEVKNLARRVGGDAMKHYGQAFFKTYQGLTLEQMQRHIMIPDVRNVADAVVKGEILGCHDKANFLAKLNGIGQVVGQTPGPDGAVRYAYKLFQRNQDKTIKQPPVLSVGKEKLKTVVDGLAADWQKWMAIANAAADDAIRRKVLPAAGGWFSGTGMGVRIRGVFRGTEIDTFFPDF